jgi:hypothetical protein
MGSTLGERSNDAAEPPVTRRKGSVCGGSLPLRILSPFPNVRFKNREPVKHKASELAYLIWCGFLSIVSVFVVLFGRMPSLLGAAALAFLLIVAIIVEVIRKRRKGSRSAR